jgi:predicted ABC-type ATPase
MRLPLDRRPLVVSIAGPNGAGKTTFYKSFVAAASLRFVSADVIAAEFRIDAYAAASIAASLRDELIGRRESFAFETVFSDPAGDKLDFLRRAADAGYTVLLCFVGASSPEVSEERVTMRVAKGGHDVPSDKIYARFPRVLQNLRRAVLDLPNLWIFDNDDLRRPYRLVAVYESGKQVRLNPPVPKWLKPLLPV